MKKDRMTRWGVRVAAVCAAATVWGQDVVVDRVTVKDRVMMPNADYNTIVEDSRFPVNDQRTTVVVGANALSTAKGWDNVAVGMSAGCSSTGGQNTVVGYCAGYKATGNENSAFGSGSLINFVGDGNTALGHYAMWTRATYLPPALGDWNTAVGWESFMMTDGGDANTALGAWALYGVLRGSTENTAVGAGAMAIAHGNSGVLAVGVSAGSESTNGEQNIFIGYQSGMRVHNVTNVTLIGRDLQAARNNVMVLGNGQDVGIGTSDPEARLHVAGDVRLDGALSVNGTVVAGTNCAASGAYARAEGYGTTASADYSMARGAYSTASAYYASADGYAVTSSATCAHGEGNQTLASGLAAHAEGSQSVAMGDNSHAEGQRTVASNRCAHAEGTMSMALGWASHAEGVRTMAAGHFTHAEGFFSVASNNSAHAEGSYTLASGQQAHAEGMYTVASGLSSHAEGDHTVAGGDASHAAGFRAKATNHLTYVWSDGADIGSTAEKQYTVHASGGTRLLGGNVGVKKEGPARQALDVNGSAELVGSLLFDPLPLDSVITVDTTDGLDNRALWLNGAGGWDNTYTRGASVFVGGNEYPTYGGDVWICAGDTDGGEIHHTVRNWIDMMTIRRDYTIDFHDKGLSNMRLNTNLKLNGKWLSNDGGNEGVSVDNSGNVTISGYLKLKKNVKLNNRWLSGDGGNEGVFVTSAGNVGVGTSAPATRLDVNGPATVRGAMDMKANRIANVKDPTEPQDAATKGYVDGAVGNAGSGDVSTAADNTYAAGTVQEFDMAVANWAYVRDRIGIGGSALWECGPSSFAQGGGATASGYGSFASGEGCEAVGDHSRAEGMFCHATEYASQAAGREAWAAHTNSYVWSDGTEMKSTTNKQFTVFAGNGVRLMSSPEGASSFLGGKWQIEPQGDLDMGEFTSGGPATEGE